MHAADRRVAPAPITVELTIDGSATVCVTRPASTLLDLLRDDLDLTATKVGCEMGNCGACTILLDETPVYSCLVLAAECDGRTVETAAGLTDGASLGAVQQAFAECDALQCGYCTPGQVVSVESLRRRVADGESFDDASICHALAGNLCRCGAYRNILDAARRVTSRSAS